MFFILLYNIIKIYQSILVFLMWELCITKCKLQIPAIYSINMLETKFEKVLHLFTVFVVNKLWISSQYIQSI
jgi:hypothetical protein